LRIGPILALLAIPVILGAMLNQPWMITVAVSIAALMVAAHYWRQHALDHVHFRRRFHYTRGFPGETTDLRVEIENRKRLPVSWLKAVDTWPLAVPPDKNATFNTSSVPKHGSMTNIFNLRWYEKIRRTYTVTFKERGVHQLGPLRLDSGDLFGIFDTTKTIESRPMTPLASSAPAARCLMTPTSQWAFAPTTRKMNFGGCIGRPPPAPAVCKSRFTNRLPPK